MSAKLVVFFISRGRRGGSCRQLPNVFNHCFHSNLVTFKNQVIGKVTKLLFRRVITDQWSDHFFYVLLWQHHWWPQEHVLRPQVLTLEQISCRLVAMALAGVSQRNTWHFRILVFLSLATYAKSLREGTQPGYLTKKKKKTYKAGTFKKKKREKCKGGEDETDSSQRRMSDKMTFIRLRKTRMKVSGPQRSIHQCNEARAIQMNDGRRELSPWADRGWSQGGSTEKESSGENRWDLAHVHTDFYHSETSLRACANSALCFNSTPRWKRKPNDLGKIKGIRH